MNIEQQTRFFLALNLVSHTQGEFKLETILAGISAVADSLDYENAEDRQLLEGYVYQISDVAKRAKECLDGLVVLTGVLNALMRRREQEVISKECGRGITGARRVRSAPPPGLDEPGKL